MNITHNSKPSMSETEREPSGGGTDPTLRVLHVITRLIVGGAQENTLLTAAHQQRMGMDVTLLAGPDPGPEGDLQDAARRAGVALHILPSLVRPLHPVKDAVALFQLQRFMRRGRFDVVHTHSSKAGILGRIAARIAGVETVIHTVHGLAFHPYQAEWRNWLFVRAERMAARASDGIIGVSQKAIDGAVAAGIGVPDQYVKIFSGMELEPFLAAGDRLSPVEARRKLSIPEGAPVVGKIARLSPLKGHDAFLRAAALIAAEAPECRFLLVGDGILRGALEEKARRLGIADRTHFAGLVAPEEVPRYIQAMDVVVHTSLREGIARVIPQAGAVGKPIIAYELDGAPEVVRNGVSGYLVPPGDVEAIARHVLDLLEDASLRARMGAEGRAFAVEHYPAARMVDAINGLYARTRAKRSPEPAARSEPASGGERASEERARTEGQRASAANPAGGGAPAH
jgi:glycosyltransferase involved in cell wall biosynthesis